MIYTEQRRSTTLLYDYFEITFGIIFEINAYSHKTQTFLLNFITSSTSLFSQKPCRKENSVKCLLWGCYLCDTSLILSCPIDALVVRRRTGNAKDATKEAAIFVLRVRKSASLWQPPPQRHLVVKSGEMQLWPVALSSRKTMAGIDHKWHGTCSVKYDSSSPSPACGYDVKLVGEKSGEISTGNSLSQNADDNFNIHLPEERNILKNTEHTRWAMMWRFFKCISLYGPYLIIIQTSLVCF